MTMPVVPIAKNGSCPPGWRSAGNYCIANSSNPKTVIPKSGSCPPGYRSAGNYCIEN